MLVLTRKIGEQIVIGDGVIVSVQRVASGRVSFAIEANTLADRSEQSVRRVAWITQDVLSLQHTVRQMERLLRSYLVRYNDLRNDPRFRHVIILKNYGAPWSRYPHKHSHIIAMPFTPRRRRTHAS